ncbi:basic salivary proline-rich protein 2-like isoform X2 [Pteropus medius]|uniref:basic salivary proline-rich protein 2-like isoform X2 n=1 Tax=Pteropus vampyrus TaxID=132908 RepID=UPI00196B86D0|nr:basic salivary proline-rich protein 2-like isoform X2 [Pteropus giganteus]
MGWREAETKRPRRRDTARASLGGDTQTEQAGGNQEQGERWGVGDPNGPPRSPLHRPGLAPTWLSPGAVVPPSRAPSRGRTCFGKGAAVSEPPRSRRPSPRPQRLTRRGKRIAPAPGGGAGIRSIPGERRGRRWGQEEPENWEPRSGNGGARWGQRDRTGLGIHWLRGPVSRDQRAVQAEDPKRSRAGGGVHGNPQEPRAQERRIRGAGAGIQPESSGRGRDLVDPEGGQEWEVRGVRGRGWELARLLGGKEGVMKRLQGTLSRWEARTPGSARQGPPAPRPSQPESDDPPAEQPQQPRASPRGRLPRPLQRERRTPLARACLPARPPSGVWGDWRRYKRAGVDRPTDGRSGLGRGGDISPPPYLPPSRLSRTVPLDTYYTKPH